MTVRVAITGLGAVTPVGHDVGATWDSLVAGRSGVGPITTFDASAYPVRIAALVEDFTLAPYLPDRLLGHHVSRAGGFGIAAAAQAMADAGGDGVYAPEEQGVAMGASAGRPESDELVEVLGAYQRSGGHDVIAQSPTSLLRRQQNVAVNAIARQWSLRGPMVGISTACSASTQAIGEAFRHIQEGDARLMVAGGFDALTTWLDVLGFTLLGALADDANDDPERASRPFDRTRSGFVLGEGGVAIVLEELESARERGATILAELVGYGTSLNDYRITDAPPDGRGPILCMKAAMQDADLGPSDIDYVVAHGTSTPGNDLAETVAIREVFGPEADRLVVSSPKSMVGHLTTASGALNVLVGVLAMRTGVVPPTTNLDDPDPKLDLDYVPNVAREMPVRAVLCNAFAFGGTNGSLVVSRAGGETE